MAISSAPVRAAAATDAYAYFRLDFDGMSFSFILLHGRHGHSGFFILRYAFSI
jgi:hypothetical protein